MRISTDYARRACSIVIFGAMIGTGCSQGPSGPGYEYSASPDLLTYKNLAVVARDTPTDLNDQKWSDRTSRFIVQSLADKLPGARVTSDLEFATAVNTITGTGGEWNAQEGAGLADHYSVDAIVYWNRGIAQNPQFGKRPGTIVSGSRIELRILD